MSKETSIQVLVKISIKGKEFSLTKEEAQSLAHDLSAAFGVNPTIHIHPTVYREANWWSATSPIYLLQSATSNPFSSI